MEITKIYHGYAKFKKGALFFVVGGYYQVLLIPKSLIYGVPQMYRRKYAKEEEKVNRSGFRCKMSRSELTSPGGLFS
jgi:hypothetical protein